ncbi:MAG TPA: hypothetical protein VHZ98_16310 [Galbitalea sp.]|nr:hypothetical protein [Galbitalea sp.]
MASERVLDKYYDGLTKFLDAVRDRDYQLAAQIQRLNIAELEKNALPNFRKEFGAVPSIPVIEAVGIAVAAMYPSADMQAAFDRLATSPELPDFRDGGLTLRTATEMVASIRATVDEKPGLDRVQLRKAVGVADGRLFGNLVGYLVKAKLIFEREGTYSSLAKPQALRQEKQSGFRSGQTPNTPSMIRLWELPPIVGTESATDPWAYAPPEIGPAAPDAAVADLIVNFSGTRPPWAPSAIPAERRRKGKASTATMQDNTWLFRYTRPASATEDQYTAEILDRAGNSLRTITFEHAVSRTVAFSDRTTIAIVDNDACITVYRQDGELLSVLPLSGNPELETEFAAHGDDHSRRVSRVHAFDVDPEEGRMLFAARNKIWCANLRGDILWSLQTPSAPRDKVGWDRATTPKEISKAAERLHVRPDNTPREIAAYLDSEGDLNDSGGLTFSIGLGRHHASAKEVLRNQLNGWSSDWVYSASLSRGRASFSTYSGLNVDVTDQGQIERMWLSPGTFHPFQSDAASTRIGQAGYNLVTLAAEAVTGDLSGADPLRVMAPFPGSAFGTEQCAVSVDGATVSVWDAKGQKVNSYRCPKPITSAYPTTNGITIEMGTAWATLPV